MRYLFIGIAISLLFTCKNEVQVQDEIPEIIMEIQSKQTKKVLKLNTVIEDSIDSLQTFYTISSSESVALKNKVLGILDAGLNKSKCENDLESASKNGFNAYFENDPIDGKKYFIFGYSLNGKGMHVRWDVDSKKDKYFLNKDKYFKPNANNGEELQISKKQIQDILSKFESIKPEGK